MFARAKKLEALIQSALVILACTHEESQAIGAFSHTPSLKFRSAGLEFEFRAQNLNSNSAIIDRRWRTLANLRAATNQNESEMRRTSEREKMRERERERETSRACGGALRSLEAIKRAPQSNGRLEEQIRRGERRPASLEAPKRALELFIRASANNKSKKASAARCKICSAARSLEQPLQSCWGALLFP